MFLKKIEASITELVENPQTHFQCIVAVSAPIELVEAIQPGMLLAVENIYHSAKEERYCIVQVLSTFPAQSHQKKKNDKIVLRCLTSPIGIELKATQGKKKGEIEITTADVLPQVEAPAYALDDEMTRQIIHHLSPVSRDEENGSRIDIGNYSTNPEVAVGVDSTTLLRGNIAIVSAKARARTTITNSLIHSLLAKQNYPMHVVYCDVNYQGTLSVLPELMQMDNSHILCLNDKFVPASVFTSLKTPGDRQSFKRAVYDYLDMMLLPSIIESRRKDFLYPIASMFRGNKLSIYRAHELTVDEFITDIRMDLLDGVDSDVEELVGNMMRGIADNFKGERFNEKNVRDMIDMIDESSQETKNHGARRILYDLRNEILAVVESYGKDLPAHARMTLSDVANKLNEDTRSSFLVVQGQKSFDILRFVSALTNKLVEERLRRLKVRVPVLFIFNNADDYFARGSASIREGGNERFIDILNSILFHGRRHGLSFCMSLENCASLDKSLARKIQSYFVGPIRYSEDVGLLENLLNISGSLFQPAVSYEDGHCLFTSADSPYQRRVPLPCTMPTSIESLHNFLDDVLGKQDQLRKENPTMDQMKEPPQEVEKTPEAISQQQQPRREQDRRHEKHERFDRHGKRNRRDRFRDKRRHDYPQDKTGTAPEASLNAHPPDHEHHTEVPSYTPHVEEHREPSPMHEPHEHRQEAPSVDSANEQTQPNARNPKQNKRRNQSHSRGRRRKGNPEQGNSGQNEAESNSGPTDSPE